MPTYGPRPWVTRAPVDPGSGCVCPRRAWGHPRPSQREVGRGAGARQCQNATATAHGPSCRRQGEDMLNDSIRAACPRGSAPCGRGPHGACRPGPWSLATPQARHMLARAQTWVPTRCRASRPQRCASWRCGARTPLGRHPPHGRQSVGGCCVVLPPRPPCLPVIFPTGCRHFFDSVRLPATPSLGSSSTPRPAPWPHTRAWPLPTRVVRVLHPLWDVSGTAVGRHTHAGRTPTDGPPGRHGKERHHHADHWKLLGTGSPLRHRGRPRAAHSRVCAHHQIRRAAAGIAVAGLHRARRFDPGRRDRPDRRDREVRRHVVITPSRPMRNFASGGPCSTRCGVWTGRPARSGRKSGPWRRPMRPWNAPTAGQAATRRWLPCWGSTWRNSTRGSRRCGGCRWAVSRRQAWAHPTAMPSPCTTWWPPMPPRVPRQRVQAQQRTALLAEAIEALPQQEKVVIALYYHEELTMKEIGQVLDGDRIAGLADPYQGHLPSPQHAHGPPGRLSALVQQSCQGFSHTYHLHKHHVPPRHTGEAMAVRSTKHAACPQRCWWTRTRGASDRARGGATTSEGQGG